MLFSLDSNVLIYAESATDKAKAATAVEFVEAAGRDRLLLPMQACGETLNWLLKKGGLTRAGAARRIGNWFRVTTAVPVSTEAFVTAVKLVERHQLQIWDSVMLAASAEAGANYLLSEDMQHGFTWGGVTILNPFILSKSDLFEMLVMRPVH